MFWKFCYEKLVHKFYSKTSSQNALIRSENLLHTKEFCAKNSVSYYENLEILFQNIFKRGNSGNSAFVWLKACVKILSKDKLVLSTILVSYICFLIFIVDRVSPLYCIMPYLNHPYQNPSFLFSLCFLNSELCECS